MDGISASPSDADAAPAPERWSRIRLFAMDVDGVLTDGTIRISSDGTESKVFSVLDGLGLVRLRRIGIILAWISGRQSEATRHRAEELNIAHLVQGRAEKREVLEKLASELGLTQDQICYMGDDDIDAAAMRWAGIGIAVQTAVPAALAAADIVTTRPAGYGAVREVCDWIQTHHSGDHAS